MNDFKLVCEMPEMMGGDDASYVLSDLFDDMSVVVESEDGWWVADWDEFNNGPGVAQCKSAVHMKELPPEYVWRVALTRFVPRPDSGDTGAYGLSKIGILFVWRKHDHFVLPKLVKSGEVSHADE